jgi:thiamine pyrophosphokinase
MRAGLDARGSRSDSRAVRAVICVGGEAPSRDRALSLLRTGDFLVAADSGFGVLESYGLNPDLIAGDMDSIENDRVLTARIPGSVIRVPRAKDESDTELCLRLAWERGYAETAILGGGGGRIDHFAALLFLFERARAPDEWYLPHESATRIDGEFIMKTRPGDRMSLIPLGPAPLVMESSGLTWPLDGLKFPRGFMSLSNEASAEVVRLHVVSGRALLVRPYGSEA